MLGLTAIWRSPLWTLDNPRYRHIPKTPPLGRLGYLGQRDLNRQWWQIPSLHK